MSKKIKRSKTEGVFVDPNLEDVDEERAFEIDDDEETDEIIFVHHYRRKWGDDFDADIDHVMTVDEAANMVGIVVSLLDMIKARQLIRLGLVKMTPVPIEGNPMEGPRIADIVAPVIEKKGGEGDG